MSMDQPGRFRGFRSNQWQDWINLILAIWLFISPWVLNFATAAAPGGGTAGAPGGAPATGGGAVPGATTGAASGNAAWNAWVLGVIIGIIAIAAIIRLVPWQEWVNLLLGIWVFIAPWVLGFTGLANASWDHWIVGFLVFIFALWNMSLARPLTRARVDLAHAGDRPVDRPIDRPGAPPPR